ncbi:MAG: Na+/H+ antiporter subunit E [Verrucomicrobia bacterium]|nr:Na+/H+ antiporter subunit E [Verrucomicrobiota bacterium]
MAVPSTPHALGRFLARAAWMGLVWFGLNGADWASWVVGGPAVLAAAWVSVSLLPAIPWRWSFGGAMAFAPYFLRESLRGGWDVARRAVSPAMRLVPGIVRYPFHLPSGPARLFFCSAISLLPGTAVVAIAPGEIAVHVLECTPRVEADLRELERRVAALFGVGRGGEPGGAG